MSQLPAKLESVKSIFKERFKFSQDIVDRSAAAFGDEWIQECEETLSKLFRDNDSLTKSIEGYSAFAFDSMRRQKKFEKERKYPNKTYEEAKHEVYMNEDYMMTQYLPGLLLSHYLWPHHYRQIQFFDTAFVGPMKRAKAGLFAEVGIGTGLYSRRILQKLPQTRGLGFDISPSSKRFADHHISSFGFQDRYQVLLQDVIAQPMTPVDWLVCVEVLEHLEDPVTFLKALRGALLPGGKAFITAALNAANADHIYLYETAEQVQAHLQQAGFTVEQYFLGAAYKAPAPEIPVPLAAAFVVF